MKYRKGFIALILTLAIVMNLINVIAVPAFAHNAILEVDYDDCVDYIGDGINEMWYALQNDVYGVHYPHDISTITYRFVDDPAAGYSWTPSGKSSSVGEEIKTVFAASMEKWNNVYFYSYNDDGTITKNKIINVVEVTQGDANITIYPATINELEGAAAQVIPDGYVWVIEDEPIAHYHAPTWRLDVNIDAFYDNSPLASLAGLSSSDIAMLRENTGAHEFGHVLGLLDLDYQNLCNANDPDWHHHEVLMGYGEPVNQRSANITYKDIAGVAITRGFHTDNDHKWLNCGLQSDGKYKLICSICNGVKMVDSLSEYESDTYNMCNNNHTLSSGNMFAVASYGTLDYYKCKYCRFVAPFDSNVSQNYTKTYYNNSLHKCVNTIEGLEYTFYEEHNHDKFTYLNSFSHKKSCDCGINAQIESHSIYASDIIPGNYYAPCMGCGYLLDLRDDHYNTIASITKVSINGSYVLPSGIVVLVDEDIQAYLDGTLVFYHPNNIPTIQ